MISTQLNEFFTQELKHFWIFICLYQIGQFIIFYLKKEFCESIEVIRFYNTLKIMCHFTNSLRVPNSYVMFKRRNIQITVQRAVSHVTWATEFGVQLLVVINSWHIKTVQQNTFLATKYTIMTLVYHVYLRKT